MDQYNKKKHKLIEILLLTLFFPSFIIIFQLQIFVIPMLLFASITIIFINKEQILKNLYPSTFKSYLELLCFDITVISVVFLFMILSDNNFEFLYLSHEEYSYFIFISLFYLFFSVIPQEIIFRFLFFQRYEFVFGKYHLIFINSLVFSLLHIIYFDIYLLFLSFFGNILFTINYFKYRSILLVVIEHYLIGQSIIILGFFNNFNSSIIKKLYNLLLFN